MKYTNYADQFADVLRRATEIRYLLDIGQRYKRTEDHPMLESAESRANSMWYAAQKTELFQKYPLAKSILKPVLSAWGQSFNEYVRTTGRMPSDGILANAHQAFENLLNACEHSRYRNTGRSVNNVLFESGNQQMPGKALKDEHAIFESAMNEIGTLEASEGVARLAFYGALILPVSLGAFANELVAFVPAPSDQSCVFRLSNVAASDFGSFKKGDELNMQSAGVYAQLNRRYVLKATNQPNDTKKTFSFDIKEYEGVAAPVRPGRVKLLVDRVESGWDTEHNKSLYWSGKSAAGDALEADCTIDYLAGKMDITFTTAPKKGVELCVLAEIDIERNPALIPLANLAMTSYEVRPSYYALATEHSVQALFDASREFGIDLDSNGFTELTNWLTHEQNTARLRLAAFYARDAGEWDVSIPDKQQYASWSAVTAGRIHQLSSDMCSATLSTGIKGAFVGSTAAQWIKGLPAREFQPVANPSTRPGVRRIGRLYGVYDIFEVPEAMCHAFSNDPASPVAFAPSDCIFYGTGERIGAAGILAGDAVPPTPTNHPMDKTLRKRSTVIGSMINELNPDGGRDYLVRLKVVSKRPGGINPFTGGDI